MPVAILERAQNLRDGLNRIGRRAAVHAGMQIVTGAFDEQLGIHHAAQTHADGGQLRREHFGIADHRGIGFQARGPGLDVLFDVLAAGFLFAFEQKLYVHGQFASGLQQAFDGLDLDVHLAFIVDRAAGEDVVAANGGLERRRFPFVQRIGRLHIVVSVKEDGGLAGGREPLRVDKRIAIALDQFGRGHAGG